MLQAVPTPIIRSSNCIYSIGYFVKLVPATFVVGTSKILTKYPMLYIHVQFELLMMGGGTA